MTRIPVDGQYCYVCSLDQEDDIRFLAGRICFCCGIQYDDFEVDLELVCIERQYWIDGGYLWFRSSKRPEKWNPIEQLNQLPEKYR